MTAGDELWRSLVAGANRENDIQKDLTGPRACREGKNKKERKAWALAEYCGYGGGVPRAKWGSFKMQRNTDNGEQG